MSIRESEVDYTGKMGSLYAGIPTIVEWPMCSFDRAAHCFWNGVANELIRQGRTEEQVKDWLQSKNARWMLDAHGDRLSDLGAELVRLSDSLDDDV